jgi:hypothetical protein
MRPESSRAATAAAAPLESTQVVYSGTARSASAVTMGTTGTGTVPSGDIP